MNTALPMFAIGLIFGGGIGFAIAAGNGITFDGHDHGNPAHHGAHADHAAHGDILSLSENGAPTMAVTLHPDPLSGYSLHIAVENFVISPENASLDHVAGQGHAHVYVDGNKLGRFYGPWVLLDGVAPGAEVQVTLNANDHRLLAVGDQPLAEPLIIPH